MSLLRGCGAALLCLAACLPPAARADADDTQPQAASPAPSALVPSPPPAAASAPDAGLVPPPAAAAASGPGDGAAPAPKPKPYEWKWEGAIGPVVSVAPDYAGSKSRKYSLTPGYYLRYGRISISNTSGFVTRRNNDDIFRGLGLDFKRTDRVRLNVALRLDNGRRSADFRGLEGIENVRRTLRARGTATWLIGHGNKIVAGLSSDLLGRGGGNVVDLSANHDRRWSERTTFGVGVGLSAADQRYMQSYYGITPSESTASGHPVFSPSGGMQLASAGVSWRMQINDRWIGLWGGSVSRLLGPAARSPLTTPPTEWGASAGVAWQF